MDWNGRLRANPKKTEFLNLVETGEIELDEEGGLHVDERYEERPGVLIDEAESTGEEDEDYTEMDAKADEEQLSEQDDIPMAPLVETKEALICEVADIEDDPWLVHEEELRADADACNARANAIMKKATDSLIQYKAKLELLRNERLAQEKFNDVSKCSQNETVSL